MTLRELLEDNFGRGDAANFIIKLADFGPEIEDGILDDDAYEKWLDLMVETFEEIIEIED